MRKTLLPALIAGLVLALAGPAAPAGAAIRDIDDPAGDLMIATSSEDSPDGFTYERSDEADGDIILARVKHTATQVVLYVRYRELFVPRQYAGLEYGIEGTNGQVRNVSLETRHGRPQGRVSMFDQRGRRVRCTVAHKVNYVTNSVSMRFPRRCIRTAKYVRVTHVSYRLRIDGRKGQAVIAFDDPMREGGRVNQVFTKPSPWVLGD